VPPHQPMDRRAQLRSLRSVWHMPIPLFLAELRELVGTRPLWLMSAHAAVTDAAGNLLLCRRADDDQWSLPGGIIEPGEQPADAVIRECREEAGIIVEPTSLALADVSPTFTYPVRRLYRMVEMHRCYRVRRATYRTSRRHICRAVSPHVL
jgi:8-oxo-dGTP pyrophosphatase MutT (NUDIX family)